MNESMKFPVDDGLRIACMAAIPDLHRYCRDSWTLIGSAAAWLLGAEVVVADLDVLTTVRDADALYEQWQSCASHGFIPGDAGRFRSSFNRYDFAGLPVKVMGGLEVAGARGWVSITTGEVLSVDVFDLAINVPSAADQIRIFHLFARPKDLQRASLLESLIGQRPC